MKELILLKQAMSMLIALLLVDFSLAFNQEHKALDAFM